MKEKDRISHSVRFHFSVFTELVYSERREWIKHLQMCILHVQTEREALNSLLCLNRQVALI